MTTASESNQVQPEPKPLRKPSWQIDLRQEAVLDPTIDFSQVETNAGHSPVAKTIFLTGATGFLGVYLLHDLLRQTTATLYCLVRASDAEAGMERLRSKLASNELWDESFCERIVPVVGDLGLPRFGLSAETFDKLAAKVDLIVHNGAIVNFLQPYRALKAPNVDGTQEIIRLAVQSKTKPLHYVSTIFVFGGVFAGRTIYEDEAPTSDDLLLGYFQSKWVAEQLIELARARGLPAYIYRPGLIIGDSQTGRWDNFDDFLCRVIKGCIQLGLWPDMETELFLAPVNYVSQAIVYLSQQPTLHKHAYHLVNPRPVALRQMCEWMQAYGYPLEQVSLREWQTKLAAQSSNTRENALAVLAPILIKRRSTQKTLPDLVDQGNGPQFDCRNTLAALVGAPVVASVTDSAIFNNYLSYFVDSGFLPAPPSQA